MKKTIEEINQKIKEEMKYRKGFSHGFLAALQGDIGYNEVMKWVRDDETKVVGAPGTFLEGECLIDLDPEKLIEEIEMKGLKNRS